MDRKDISVSLLAQAVHEGAEPLTLRALVEEASELGAQRALDHLGLSDRSAQRDINDLRDLISSWRDVRSTARRTAVRWITTLLLSAMVLGLLVHSDVPHLKP